MKIGFIGCGNMASAILKGILKSGEVAATDIIASAKSDKTREKIEKELGIKKADTNAQVVEFADVVFLAVKPQFLEGVLDEIKARSDFYFYRTGQNSPVVCRQAWREDKGYPYNAKYTGNGRRRHDSSLCE